MAGRHKRQKEDIPPDLLIPLGQVVRSWREARGLSVTELAKRANVTKGYISLLEHNRIAQPRPEYLAKLAAALDISVWDLVARRMPTSKVPRLSMLRKVSPPEPLLGTEEIKAQLQELREIVLERLLRIEATLAKGEKATKRPGKTRRR